MKRERGLFNNKLIISILIFIPIILIIAIIVGRNIITPTNDEIVNDLKNIKYYSTNVKYEFINLKSNFEENTVQYYSANDGKRIEFKDGLERVKVYKGGEIKVEGANDEEYTLDKNIDVIYPLAFIDNIFSNSLIGSIQEVQAEWSNDIYLKINVDLDTGNKHLKNAEFYIDKNTETPKVLKIYDDSGCERVIVTYDDFKEEKHLSEELF